jgi:hypothetical protein
MLVSDADILNDVVNTADQDISMVEANALLKFRFSDRAVARMNELAQKNRDGTITDEERGLMSRFLRISNFLNLVHAKAKAKLYGADAAHQG